MLKGIDITLYEKTQSGTDEADAPVYTETPVTVHNVLVGEPSAEEITTELQLTGRRLAYTLAIPTGELRLIKPERINRATPTTGTTCRWSFSASTSAPAGASCRASSA